MPRLILDATGGELGLRTLLEGAVEAFPKLEGELVLVGREAELRAKLDEPLFAPLLGVISTGMGMTSAPPSSPACRFRIIDSGENPADAVSIGIRLAAEGQKNNLPSAFLSTSVPSAILAQALQHFGPIPRVSSPAYAVRLPTASGKDCILLDTGATIDCKPENLRDFAIMGALYAQFGLEKGALPRVAILGNGIASERMSELPRAAANAIQIDPFFQTGARQQAVFAGFADGGDLLKGQIDVAVTDGYLGNIVLRSMEGATSAVIGMVQQEAQKTILGSLGVRLASDVLGEAIRRIEYAEYTAPVVLGVRGYVCACESRSNARAVRNALVNSQLLLKHRLAERIGETFAEDRGPLT